MGVRLSATPFAAEPETRPCGALIDAGTARRKTDFAQCRSSRRRSAPSGDPSWPAKRFFEPPAVARHSTKLLIRLDNGGWAFARGAKYRPPDEAVLGLPTVTEPRGRWERLPPQKSWRSAYLARLLGSSVKWRSSVSNEGSRTLPRRRDRGTSCRRGPRFAARWAHRSHRELAQRRRSGQAM